MAEMSRSFNFDDFDEQVREALEQNDEAMADIVPIRRPGEIGGVAIKLSQEQPDDDLHLQLSRYRQTQTR